MNSKPLTVVIHAMNMQLFSMLFNNRVNSGKQRNIFKAYFLFCCVTIMLAVQFVGCSKPAKRSDSVPLSDSILLNKSINLDYISDVCRTDSAIVRLKSVGLQYEFRDESDKVLSRVIPKLTVHLGKVLAVKDVKMFCFDSGDFYLKLNRIADKYGVSGKYIDLYYYIKGGLSNEEIYKGGDAFDSLSHGECPCMRFDGANGLPNRVSGFYFFGLYSITLSSLNDTIIYMFTRNDHSLKMDREMLKDLK